jgi:MFS family permease
VRALGAVSLLTDAASDLIYPLLPLFLSSVLGAPATVLGAIEGAAQSVSSLLRLASGWWSDRMGRRLPLVVAGYAIASIARPALGFATAAWHVAVARLSDRMGKGLRTAPRDALLAESTPVAQRGRAYGFHRAMDNLGAVIGPLAAWALIEASVPLRTIFLWSVVPGVLSLVVLVILVREGASPSTRARSTDSRADADTTVRPEAGSASIRQHLRSGRPLPRPFWAYLAVLLVFTLGNSSDAFLLLRASQVGIPVAIVPVLWAAHNLVKALASTPSGEWSDSVGRRPVIIAGWIVYAVVYLLFARATDAWHVWALFLVYGLHFGLSEGVEKAYVADLVPAERLGAAFGWYNFTVGVAALPASVVFGLVWDRVSPAAAFAMGAALAGVAAVGLMALAPRRG